MCVISLFLLTLPSQERRSGAAGSSGEDSETEEVVRMQAPGREGSGGLGQAGLTQL